MLKTNNAYVPIKLLRKSDSRITFKIRTHYFLSQGDKKLMKEYIEKELELGGVYSKNPLSEQLAELDKLQSDDFIISEQELGGNRVNSILKKMFDPDTGSIIQTYNFYFTTYNKEIPENEYEAIVDQFVNIFLRNKDTAGCSLQTIKLRSLRKMPTQKI